MKILVLNKLSIFSLFIAIFFRIINFKIKFLLIKEYFRNKRFLKFLSKFNIQWFNYQDNIENNVKLLQKHNTIQIVFCVFLTQINKNIEHN